MWKALALCVVLSGCLAPQDEGTSGPAFPHVTLTTDDEASLIMDHLEGDCIALSDYTFQVNGQAKQPTAAPYGDDDAADRFCIGDQIFFETGPGAVHELIVVHEPTQTQVYKKVVEF